MWQTTRPPPSPSLSINESSAEHAALSCFGALGYLADLQEQATKTVLAQAELLSAIWAEA